MTAKLERPGGTLQRIQDAAQGGKREASEDPRKELQNMGVSRSNEAFASALLRNDLKVVKMFVAGGWNVRSFDGEGYEGSHIAHYIWRADKSDRQRTHEMLRAVGADQMESDLLRFRGVRPMSLVANAVEGCNPVVLEWLLKHGHSAQSGVEALRHYNFRLFPPQDGQQNCSVGNIAAKLGLLEPR